MHKRTDVPTTTDSNTPIGTDSSLEATGDADTLALLKKITNIIPGFIYEYQQRPDGSHHLSYISQGVERLMGISLDDLKEDASAVWSLAIDEDRELFENSVDMAVAHQTTWKLTWRIRTPQGQLKWLRGESTKIVPMKGGGYTNNGIVVDVTNEMELAHEVKAARRRSEAATRTLKEITDLLPGFVYKYRHFPNGRCYFSYISRGVEELMELQAAELRKDASIMWRHFHDDDRGPVLAELNRNIKERTPWSLHWRINTPSGKLKWIRSESTAARPLADGSFEWIGILLDVTQEKEAEKSAASAKRMLAEVNNVIPGCVYLLRQPLEGQRSFNYISQGAVEMFGLPLEAMQRDVGFLYELTVPEDLERLKQGRQESLKNKTPWHIVWRIRRPDGTIHWIRCDTKPYRTDDDGSTLWAGVLVDITEERKLQEALSESRIQAEESSHAKSDFLSNVSHEMRTPLNGILGYTQLLLHELQLEDQPARNLEAIQKCGDHLLSVINKVLDMAKIESGRLQLDLQSTALYRTLDEVITIITPLAESKGLSFNVNIAEDLPAFILTDGSRLRQILINLLNNAVKFTDSGSVCLKANTEGDTLQLDIVDTGPGMTAEDVERVFEPFTRLSNSRHKEGTGLGLTITRRLTEAMGGKLSARSTPGTGSVFTVSLPYEEAGAVEEADSSDTYNFQPLPPDIHPHILVVDDKSYNRDVVRQWLEKARFMVSEAENGQEALNAMRQSSIDLVLMDLRMPVMSGYQCIQQVREDPKLQKLPVVALSASVFPGDVRKVLMSGFDAFLAKPCNLNQLFKKIYELLSLQPEETTHQEQSEAAREPEVKQRSIPTSTIEHLEELAALGDIEGLINLLNQLSAEPEHSHQVAELQQCLQQLDMDAFMQALH